MDLVSKSDLTLGTKLKWISFKICTANIVMMYNCFYTCKTASVHLWLLRCWAPSHKSFQLVKSVYNLLLTLIINSYKIYLCVIYIYNRNACVCVCTCVSCTQVSYFEVEQVSVAICLTLIMQSSIPGTLLTAHHKCRIK